MEGVIEEQIKRFIDECQDSVAFKLMLAGIAPQRFYLGKEQDSQCAILFNAWVNGYFPRINTLLEKFKIMENGTTDFKNRLLERWLLKQEEERRKPLNNSVVTLVELAVAEFLEESGNSIIEISALSQNKNSPDIIFHYCPT